MYMNVVKSCGHLSKCFLLLVMNSYYLISLMSFYMSVKVKDTGYIQNCLQGLFLSVYATYSVSYLTSNEISGQEYTYTCVIIILKFMNSFYFLDISKALLLKNIFLAI